MSYEVYEFKRPTIDPERRVSFSRGAMVRTNDKKWIAKFGSGSVTLREDVGDDVPMTVVECPESETEKEEKVVEAKASTKRKPSVPKETTAHKKLSKPSALKDNKAVLGDDVTTTSAE